MDRRAALKALLAMPAVTSVSRAALKSDDVIVIQTERLLSDHEIEHIKRGVQSVWPQQRVVVLDAGLQLKIVAGS